MSHMNGGEHIPVLFDEVLRLLDVQPGDLVLDGTLGGGGHARALLSRALPGGRLIGLDRDGEVLRRTAETLPGDPAQCLLEQSDFAEFESVLDRLGQPEVDVALLDLGVSSFQIDDPSRGFSFQAGGPLDMRMNRQDGESAEDLVNDLPEEELADIFYNYAQERLSRRIARLIVKAREQQRITTTDELARLVLAAQPRGGHRKWQRIHPATRVFQALRIAVNRELESLQTFCDRIPRRLRSRGRVGIISFHSLEDRIVKQSFKAQAMAGVFELVTRKPVTATPEEEERNPRSRSAKLRVARKVG